MTGRLDETVAIVTGGSRGIGRAVARALVNAGAGVSIAARSDHELAETAALLRQVSDRVAAIPADVTDAGAVHRLVEETERQLGPVDVLVNNAGTCYALGPVCGGGRGRVVAGHRGEPARQLPVCPGRAAGNARPPAGADHQHGERHRPASVRL